MTINNPEQLEILKHHSKRVYEMANSEIWKKLQRALGKKHRNNWVGREELKQFEKDQLPALYHPAPTWMLNQPNQIPCIEDARTQTGL